MADVEIKYNNATIASLNDSGTEVLETNGTFLTDDITVEYTKSGGGGVSPSGSLNITNNGTYDITNYAEVVVSVSVPIEYIDYTYQETSSEKIWTLTKTAGEILSLLKSGKIVFIQVGTDEYRQLAGVHSYGYTYRFPYIEIQLFGQSELQYQKISYDFKYSANRSTDYPTFVMLTGGGGND
jgi:hypothetical protein